MSPLDHQGIDPVPAAGRRLSTWDCAVLWGDLGVGLLVLLTGSFLVPALSLPQALGAIAVGSVIGVTLLALTAVVGARTGTPTMVCLRPVLGLRGSYLPTGLNVLQLLGWTVFELVIMGYAANSVSRQVLGLDAYPLWVLLFGAIVTGMGVWGPLGVVRQWLGKVAIWGVLATTAWLTWLVLQRGDLAALLARPGTGDLPFWAAVDLVIAMPISWLPLVCDYTRFARSPGAAFWGTGGGYLVANVWLYALGALILLVAGVTQEPRGFVEAIALLAGPLVLLILLVDETDEAWADLYSCAVSVQNVLPGASLRALVLAVGAAGTLTALFLDITQYETFLLLIGSVFVPLFGVVAVHYFAGPGLVGPAAPPAGRRWTALVAWGLGFLVYLALAGKLGSLGLPGMPALGASLPSLAAAAVAYATLRLLGREPATGG